MTDALREDLAARVVELETENARLKAELSAAQQDAERYRWIREQSLYAPDGFDAEIDAARGPK